MSARDICTTVATARRGGLPDAMIALQLGITVEQLRRACPAIPSDPLGIRPPSPTPWVPGVPPWGDTRGMGREQERPPWGDVRAAIPADALAVLILLVLLGSSPRPRVSKRRSKRRRSPS